MNGWRFDPASALLGAAMALALVGLGYALREPFLRGWREARAEFRRLLGRVTASMEKRYRDAVVAWAQRAHGLAALGPLEDVFLPSPLIPPPSPPDPDVEEVRTGPLLPIRTSLKGHHRLLLSGPVASGRSTLLAHLALVHARQETGLPLELYAERLPLYLHLAHVQIDVQETNGAALLSQEAVKAIGGPPAARGAVHQHLQAGTALVLLDGWDELPPPDRERATAWLAGLVEALPGNLWVVAVGPRGYGPLTKLGFVPLRMPQWEHPQVEAFLKRCTDLLSPSEEERPSLPIQATDMLAERLKQEPSLLDLALSTWLLLSTGEIPESRGELFSRALDQLLRDEEEESDISTLAREVLDELAARAYPEGRTVFTKEEIEAALEVILPPPEERPPRVTSRALRALTGPGGPMVSCGRDRYAFSHPLWWAWLMARQARALSPSTLVNRLDDPRWLPVVDFYAEDGQMEPVVEAWLSKPDDLWRTRLCTAARWASLAPPNAPWRNGVMALLARAFLTPSLPAEVRERLGEALVRTCDPGVGIFLRQAMRHPRESVRAAAARAMGLLGDKVDLSLLAEALYDAHESVRIAAARALGRIGAPGAIRHLATVLTEAEDAVRMEAARGLALAGEEGWEVLREAIESEDFMTRRAAAFGLGEVNAPWVRPLLERVVREDGEWIVRSAASTVLAALDQAQPSPVTPPPDPANASWLIAWAAERGEGVGVGEAAFDALLRALAEGDVPVRRAAAHMLGLVGRPEHADALRQAVDDPEPEVAQTALWALEELASRYDLYIQ